MDEQTKKRILMDDKIRREVLLAEHRRYGEQVGMIFGATEVKGSWWYSGSMVKKEKRESYSKGMGDDAVWGAKKAKMSGYSESFTCKIPIDKAFERTLDSIPKMPGGGVGGKSSIGVILESAIGPKEAALAAVVGSGWSDMNFVVINMLFSAIDANNTKIQLTASAKESRIPFFNQKSSQKAAKRIIDTF